MKPSTYKKRSFKLKRFLSKSLNTTELYLFISLPTRILRRRVNWEIQSFLEITNGEQVSRKRAQVTF